MKALTRHFLPLVLLMVIAAPAFALTDQDVASITDEKPAVNAPKNAAPDITGLIMRVTLSMGVVLGLMSAAVWAARRWMPQAARTGARQTIDILAQRALGARRSLMLVRVNGRTLLIGATPQSIQMLTEFEAESGEWTEAGRPTFEDELRRGTTGLER
ncbi:flagellar biosynthetic protein FliO [bacterium]|nr:flagellar biosynthetic protein FliO [bacterium]